MKVHFIGIGGIGVSSLAQYYLAKSCKVSGSDLVYSEITETLKQKGAVILIGRHKRSNLLSWKSSNLNSQVSPKQGKLATGQAKPQSKIQNFILPDLVVYSPAVQKSNPELKEARRLKIRCLSYPQALGELTKQHYTIAVCGTHGKSTTSAMLSLVLIKAGLDPAVIIGTKLKEFGNSNFRMGGARHVSDTCQTPLVIEADEWQASFLNYWPKVIVLTNIEREHLDYYKDLNHILRTYEKFIRHLPKTGVLVANKDDRNTSEIIKKSKTRGARFKILGYSVKQREAEKLKAILKIPGLHNVSNALAVLTAVSCGIKPVKVTDKVIYQALSEYKGAWRRFEIKHFQIFPREPLYRKKRVAAQAGLTIRVVHDYAHHPTEIKATLQAAREKWPKKEIWLIFQPHQYQRTYYLFDDFVRVFREVPVNRAIITDIYDVAGRENKEIKEKINSKGLVEAAKKSYVIYLRKHKILDYLRENIQKNSAPIIIVMGAGDIYQLFAGGLP